MLPHRADQEFQHFEDFHPHLQKKVLESIGSFARGAHQTDDITLLLVRFRAAAEAAVS